MCFLNISTHAVGQSNMVPQFSHIVIVIGENTNASSVYGSPNAPYINMLADNGAKFTDSHGLFHPSQPDYLALFSGSNQGITNDALITTVFTTPNLGRELLDALKTYTTYSEGLPSIGFNGNASGKYVRKHNPAANWMGTGTNQIPLSTNQPFTAFPTSYDSLPSVALVIPDLCDDGHNLCPPLNNRVKQYDTWIQNNLDSYKQWCKAHNSLLIITYDEDNGTSANKIATVFYGAHVATGVYAQTINQYNLLRSLEDAEGLTTHASAATTATTIDYCWEQVSSANVVYQEDALAEIIISAYPNPFISTLNISFQLKENAMVQVELYDLLGRQLYTGKDKIDGMLGEGTHILQITSNEFSTYQGMLLLKVKVNSKTKAILLTRMNG